MFLHQITVNLVLFVTDLFLRGKNIRIHKKSPQKLGTPMFTKETMKILANTYSREIDYLW